MCLAQQSYPGKHRPNRLATTEVSVFCQPEARLAEGYLGPARLTAEYRRAKK
jgi:hypothetical protein